jgi:hypothetical protein
MAKSTPPRASEPKRPKQGIPIRLPGTYAVPGPQKPGPYTTEDFIPPGPVPLPTPDAGPPRDPAREGGARAPKGQ